MAKDRFDETSLEPEIVVDDSEPEEMTELEPDDEEAEPEHAVYDINAPNMMQSLMSTEAGKKAVKEIADRVYNEVEDAWEAGTEYRERAAKDWKMLSGDLPPKPEPFEGCANAHIPFFMRDCLLLQALVYAEVFGDFTEVFSVSPVGPDDQEIAEALSRHGNWQLSEELLDFPQEMERAILFFIMPGDVTCHSFYDTSTRRNKHEVLTPDDFIVPYVHKTTMIDYSDCPWVAKWLRLFRHQLQRKRDEWFDVDSVINAREPSFEDEPDSAPMAEAQKQMSGNEPGDDQRAPYKLVHYEGWLELPNEPDERFCKVVMDWTTKAVLQIQLLEEDDWKDRARFERQTSELAVYRGAQQQYQAAIMAPPPMPGVDPMTGMPLPPPPPPEAPQPPSWADGPDRLEDEAFAPEAVRRVPIHMFTHGKGIEAPAGPLGTGTGRVMSDLNKAANVAASQAYDAATIANGMTFLQAGGSANNKPIKIVPGRINPIPGMAHKDLKEMLIPIPIPPANPQMFAMVEKFGEYSENASQANSVLSGEAGKSGETYRGLQTRVEQANKPVSFMAAKVVRFVKNVVKNNGRLNAQFLPEKEIIAVNNHKEGTVQELEIGRSMYARDYRVVISADLRFSSQAARVAEADQIFQMATNVPQLQNNIALIQAAAKEVFTARGKDNLIKYLGPPLPPPQTPLGLPPPPPGAPPPPGPGPQNGPPRPNGPPPAPPSAPQPGPPVGQA